MSAVDGELGILARRRIEAEIIKPIYEILVRDYGKQSAQAVIGEAVSQAAVKAGKYFADREPEGASLEGFVALQELWEKDDALKVDIIASDASHYDYDVHRCRYAEMYHEMGLGEIGHLLSCNRDELFIVGYDPNVELTRTQTIMQGASHCNFRYKVKDQEPKS
ncbi:L-2-amino-thiazoline-4-carboxylic acid hydrolase [Pseudomonas sp. NPDC090202]|uniref:L-2-amino-thiazoline-4-carboxylic acid hydrolase n=1 Tax=unclassified Pseudomonas TaxID=196821 RepID=UPI0037F1ACCA